MPLVRVIGSWVFWWAILFGLYLLFAAKLAAAEALVGGVAAALAATGTMATARAADLHFRPRIRWLRLIVRIPGRVLADCGIVGLALWRRIVQRQNVDGTFRIVPFDPGSDDAVSVARRALVTGGVSLAPNTYVVAVDRQRSVLLVHQLVPSAEPPGGGDREWPL